VASLLTTGRPFSGRNGKRVSQIEASARIRKIGEEPGNSEISTGFRELAGKAENERSGVQKKWSETGYITKCVRSSHGSWSHGMVAAQVVCGRDRHLLIPYSYPPPPQS
jgi:hypothetical protein